MYDDAILYRKNSAHGLHQNLRPQYNLSKVLLQLGECMMKQYFIPSAWSPLELGECVMKQYFIHSAWSPLELMLLLSDT